MTTEEKRMSLLTKCAKQVCNTSCPLHMAGIKCGEGTSFMKKVNGKWDMPDALIEKAYSLMFEAKHTKRKNEDSNFHGCPFNHTLQCDSPETKCERCGWNPEEHERRKKRLKFLFESQHRNSRYFVHLRLRRK